MSLTNEQIAELLAVESDKHEGNKYKAARRASRKAYGWPDEAADMVAEGTVGGGTGMQLYDFAGGIGTASRRVGAWHVGVLLQCNFGEREYRPGTAEGDRLLALRLTSARRDARPRPDPLDVHDPLRRL